jgi:hypothetical protein
MLFHVVTTVEEMVYTSQNRVYPSRETTPNPADFSGSSGYEISFISLKISKS